MQGTANNHLQSDVTASPSSSALPHPPALRAQKGRSATLAGIAVMGLALWLLLSWGAWTHTSLQERHSINGSWGAALLIPFGVPISRSSPIHVGGASFSGPYVPSLACTSSGQQSLGSPIVITPDQWVCGNVDAFDGDVMVLGRVSGNVQVIRGNVRVLGEVDGDVTTVDGDIRIQGHGSVSGQAQALGGSVYLSGDSAFSNQSQRQRVVSQPPFLSWVIMQLLTPDGGSLWLSLLFWFFASLCAAVVTPKPLRHLRDTVRTRPAGSLLIGVVAGVAAAFAGVALTMTCLGIPLALALGVLVILSWVVGTLAVGATLGRWLLRPFAHRHEPRLALSTILGTLLLGLIKAIPYVGLAVGIFVGALGVGATLLAVVTIRRAKNRRPGSPMPSTGASSS